MPPSDHAALPSEPISSPAPDASTSLNVAKMRQAARSDRPLPLSHSEASLPIRQPTPTAAALYAATLTPPGSRSMSPVGFGAGVRAVDRVVAGAGRRISSLPAAAAAAMARTASSSETTATGGGGAFPPPPPPRAPATQPPLPPRGAPFARSLLESPAVADDPGDPLRLLLQAFVPHVAVFASRDTDALARDKGFRGGLWELLRPFGEQVAGKVHVRDSNGAARAWDDFAVRFVRFGDHVEPPASVQGIVPPVASPPPPLAPDQARAPRNATADRIPLVEAIVEKHLRFAERTFLGGGEGDAAAASSANAGTRARAGTDAGAGGATPAHRPQHDDLRAEHTSPYYSLYLRRLLSGLPVACHETFAHPVACVIAISSRNGAPIQTFQELYHAISEGDQRLPPWVDGEFLRYYVLVHDEDRGDIVQSMALFEQMKRKLGLHCHLLRIRSATPTVGAETGDDDDDDDDDDCLQLPRSDWRTAAEEYADLTAAEAAEAADAADGAAGLPDQYLFASDAAAIRTFVREMVTQSIVPTMERNVTTWNDQWASRRKGLSGRFVSLSRRWAGFGGGGTAGTAAGAGGGGGGSSPSPSGSNYDAQRGFYRADAAEAVLRKLADYAFMLRDWKLAMATYDLVRSDFSNDKAWRYHAAANEMCALASLVMAPALSSRTKLETIQNVLEQAQYSYGARCGNAYGAVRTAALALELLRLRGGRAHVDAAARWGTRLLEARLVGPVGDALLRERMAVCCAARPGVGAGDPLAYGRWRRKAAFWSVLAAEAWVRQAKYIQAQRCLNAARNTYAMLPSDDGISGFALARQFMAALQQALKAGLTVEGVAAEGSGEDKRSAAAAAAAAAAAETEAAEGAPVAAAPAEAADKDDADGPVEVLVDEASDKRARRRSRHNSLLGGSGAGPAGLESAPLQRRRRLSTAGAVAEEPAAEAQAAADAGPAAADSGFGQV